MMRRRIWVDKEFQTKLKIMAAKKGVSVIALTKNLDVSLNEDCYRKKKKVFTEKWVRM